MGETNVSANTIIGLIMYIVSNITGEIVNTMERLNYMYETNERVRQEVDYIING